MGGQAPDSSLPKEQPVDHAAVVFPRDLRCRSLSLARARVGRVGLLLIPPVHLACVSDSRMRLALVPDWSVPAKAEEQLMRSKFPQLAGGQQLS